jgi:hypothetical protein
VYYLFLIRKILVGNSDKHSSLLRSVVNYKYKGRMRLDESGTRQGASLKGWLCSSDRLGYSLHLHQKLRSLFKPSVLFKGRVSRYKNFLQLSFDYLKIIVRIS